MQETNEDLYRSAMQHLLPEVFANGVITVFAYGTP